MPGTWPEQPFVAMNGHSAILQCRFGYPVNGSQQAPQFDTPRCRSIGALLQEQRPDEQGIAEDRRSVEIAQESISALELDLVGDDHDARAVRRGAAGKLHVRAGRVAQPVVPDRGDKPKSKDLDLTPHEDALRWLVAET